MQAAGLKQVEAVRNDGRWASAYAGSATMVMPEDFLAALKQDPATHAFYTKPNARGCSSHQPPAEQRPAPRNQAEAHDGAAC